MVQVNQSVHFSAHGTTYKVLSGSKGGSAAFVEHKALELSCTSIHVKTNYLYT